MTADEMWKRFCETKNIDANTHHSAWQFGAAPDKLAELVLAGTKTATASAFPLYEKEIEPLPKVGEYSVILSSTDEAICIIQTTNIKIVPFFEVDAKQAYFEGEGDRSLEYWREVHEEFFANSLGECGLTFSPDMKVVCEEFTMVFH